MPTKNYNHKNYIHARKNPPMKKNILWAVVDKETGEVDRAKKTKVEAKEYISYYGLGSYLKVVKISYKIEKK